MTLQQVMAEKWDDGANDSPEVVYDGFSPPPPQPQGLTPNTPPPQTLPPPLPAFVGGEGDGTGQMGGGVGGANYLTDPQMSVIQVRWG